MNARITFRSQRGFTIVELLVAIGVLSLLIALLLPAVQRSRAAARRAQCQSNLRQMGIAMHSYHELHSGFPPGYSPRFTVGKNHVWRNEYATYGWAVSLLPSLGGGSLYDRLDTNRYSLQELLENNSDAANLVQTQLPIFRCPDDLAEETMETAPLAEQYRFLNVYDSQAAMPIAGATSSYVGNCGYYGPYHANAATAGARIKHTGAVSGPNNGLFWPASDVGMNDVTDGASQTIAIGERAWFQGSATWVGTPNVRSWGPGGAPVCLGRVYWRINELPDPPGILITPKNGLTIKNRWTARSGFSSYHQGGANFLFVDGSVHFLSENIDHRTTTPSHGMDVIDPVPDVELLGVYQRLGIRNDGQTIGEF